MYLVADTIFKCWSLSPQLRLCILMFHLVQGRSLRTLRGHQAPVSTLADQLVGKEGSPPVLASGGTDGTVRLWSLSSSSSSNRGRSPLLATLHGLEPSIKELAVAGYEFFNHFRMKLYACLFEMTLVLLFGCPNQFHRNMFCPAWGFCLCFSLVRVRNEDIQY